MDIIRIPMTGIVYRQDMECYQQMGLRETIKGVKDFEALGVHDGVWVPRCNKCRCEFHPAPSPESLGMAVREREEKREYVVTKLGLPTEMAVPEVFGSHMYLPDSRRLKDEQY